MLAQQLPQPLDDDVTDEEDSGGCAWASCKSVKDRAASCNKRVRADSIVDTFDFDDEGERIDRGRRLLARDSDTNRRMENLSYRQNNRGAAKLLFGTLRGRTKEERLTGVPVREMSLFRQRKAYELTGHGRSRSLTSNPPPRSLATRLRLKVIDRKVQIHQEWIRERAAKLIQHKWRIWRQRNNLVKRKGAAKVLHGKSKNKAEAILGVSKREAWFFEGRPKAYTIVGALQDNNPCMQVKHTRSQTAKELKLDVRIMELVACIRKAEEEKKMKELEESKEEVDIDPSEEEDEYVDLGVCLGDVGIDSEMLITRLSTSSQ